MKNKIFILVLLISFLIVIENLFFVNFIERTIYLFDDKGLAKAGFYLFVTLLGYLAISMTFFIKNRVFFAIVFSIEIIAYLVFKLYKDINGYGFGLTELTVAYAELGQFSADVWSTYGSYLVYNLMIFLPVILLVYFFRKKVIHKYRYYFSLSSLLLVLVLAFSSSYFIVHRTINETSTSPIPVKVVNTIAYFVENRPYYGDRKDVVLVPTKESKYKNIIWIVDESIAANYLSINGYTQKDTTPYLASIGKNYLNLGFASSAGNCSAMSNIILMSGTQLADLPDSQFNTLKKANIFQYAKKAGFKTHYISGQSRDDKLQNYMTKFDLDDIDNFFQPTGEFSSDVIPEKNVIEKTHEFLNFSDKNFMYIVKRGAHFHWEGTYPDEHKIFKPTLTSTESLLLENRDRAINSYTNSVVYNVDIFFKEFFKRTKLLNRKDTLIIYTSDHGQSILESAEKSSTHCDSTNPPPSQGLVPLLIFKNRDDKLFQDSSFTVDSYSHYQIFPTTLSLMGYENIENTFFSKNRNEQKFCSGDIFGRSSLMKTKIIVPSK